MRFYLGLDFGTSGARAIAIDEGEIPRYEGRVMFESNPSWLTVWQETLWALLARIPPSIRR